MTISRAANPASATCTPKLDDPAGQGVEAVSAIRDEIKARIQALIKEIARSQPRDR